MRPLKLTAASVNKLPLLESGQVLYRDTDLQGFGIRVGAKVRTYFVEKRVNGRTVRFSLGKHGQITAEQARTQAAIKLGEMTAGADLTSNKKAARVAHRVEKNENAASAKHTVRALCDEYIKRQRAGKKQSATDAASLFAKHLTPEYANVPARALTAEQAVEIIGAVVEAGHPRTAAKLRSYLRAAYAYAQSAKLNTQASAAIRAFRVEVNPIAAVAAIENATGTRDVTLTQEELGETVRLLRERRAAQHDDALAALELSLLLGGQRLAQVLRIKAQHVDLEARTVTLEDPKGRRSTPRKHVLPLTDSAVELLKAIEKVRRADWLFGDKGSQTVPDTIARKGAELLAQAQANIAARTKGKAPARPAIQARDIRRTAETMLAAMGISKDVRAQLLSHGLGGVQDRSYDRHGYMDEKRNALQAWEARLLELADRKPATSNVKRLTRTAR